MLWLSCEGQIDIRSKGKFHITIHHISGHAENAGNECVDGAASLALKGLVSEDNVPSLWLDRRILAQRLLNAHYCLSRIAEQFARLFPDFRQVHYSVALPFLNSATSFRFSVCLCYPLAFLRPFRPTEVVQMFWKDERQCMAGTWRASASTPPGFVPDVASGEAMQNAVVLARARFEQPRHEVCWVGLGFFIGQWRYLSSAACLHLGFRAVHSRRRLWTAACRRHRL